MRSREECLYTDTSTSVRLRTVAPTTRNSKISVSPTTMDGRANIGLMSPTKHGRIMFTSDGVPVMHQKYTHVVVQEEVEPEEETPADGE